MLGKVLEACGNAEEAKSCFENAWALRKELTGVEGSAEDVDADYNALLFYWSH